mmetsp:Transcript_68227/g.134834  ORF Transcript_68227/g.134834 Transcript_68227/m.134834 type:complete len:90 (-) Transcript_68227:3-272(-)
MARSSDRCGTCAMQCVVKAATTAAAAPLMLAGPSVPLLWNRHLARGASAAFVDDTGHRTAAAPGESGDAMTSLRPTMIEKDRLEPKCLA